MSTDTEWENWGKKDPYFAVLTDEKFRSHRLSEESRIEFFESGKTHIEHVIKVCQRHLDPGFAPKRVLDFGCGTGRLVIPLAAMSEYVLGLDVSDSMLLEARKNCKAHALNNVQLLKSDDTLSCLDGCFDFIHSFIVFQHIPVKRGKRIFAKLLNHLEDGGIGAVQFTYSNAVLEKRSGMPLIERPISKLIYNTKRFVGKLDRMVFPANDPEMQMNPYNVNELFFILQSAGIPRFHAEFTDHGGELGLFLYFQKPRKN
ncbi:hypothetical protein D1AOALGA4SA_8651 [Olavius algarvensis Delta 1 endosymbiont]|nr:hypothetical protein D1AOALGA4SA_8651 [Olavius algarvensis Delta 1 endosymbiont]